MRNLGYYLFTKTCATPDVVCKPGFRGLTPSYVRFLPAFLKPLKSPSQLRMYGDPYINEPTAWFDIGRSVYHFCNIYTFQRDTQCGCTE